MDQVRFIVDNNRLFDIEKNFLYNNDRIINLNNITYIKNESLRKQYENLVNYSNVNEDVVAGLKEISNWVKNLSDYLSFEWLWDNLKKFLPSSPDEWKHFSIDSISLVLDILGPFTWGTTSVLSMLIDLLHGISYIGDATSEPQNQIENYLMGIITIGGALIPSGGNLTSITVRRIASKNGKNLKNFFQEITSKDWISNMLVKFINKLKKIPSMIDNLVKKINSNKVTKRLFEFFNGNKLVKGLSDSIKKAIKKISNWIPFKNWLRKSGLKVDDDIAKAMGKSKMTLSNKKMAKFLKEEGYLTKKGLKNISKKSLFDKKTAKYLYDKGYISEDIMSKVLSGNRTLKSVLKSVDDELFADIIKKHYKKTFAKFLGRGIVHSTGDNINITQYDQATNVLGFLMNTINDPHIDISGYLKNEQKEKLTNFIKKYYIFDPKNLDKEKRKKIKSLKKEHIETIQKYLKKNDIASKIFENNDVQIEVTGNLDFATLSTLKMMYPYIYTHKREELNEKSKEIIEKAINSDDYEILKNIIENFITNYNNGFKINPKVAKKYGIDQIDKSFYDKTDALAEFGKEKE